MFLQGWRSSFSTIINEQAERELGADVRLLAVRMSIDLMLAHTPKGMSASELAQRRSDVVIKNAIQADEIIDSTRRNPR